MYACRRYERPCYWFRSDRVFVMNGWWYFSAREGIELGPYATHLEADLEARTLSGQLASMCPGLQSRVVICQFIYDACNSGRPMSPQFGASKAG
ncbi:MAG: hypothetical protein FJ194_00475 [Gammaproteobacteria bacterium]|nr:hypothetical protein [Gammaproteobacteria bacterium]